MDIRAAVCSLAWSFLCGGCGWAWLSRCRLMLEQALELMHSCAQLAWVLEGGVGRACVVERFRSVITGKR